MESDPGSEINVRVFSRQSPTAGRGSVNGSIQISEILRFPLNRALYDRLTP